MDHKVLLCGYPVINVWMLFHQMITCILVQILCMWLITIIAFDYYNIVSSFTIYFMICLQCSKGNNISLIEATMLQVRYIIEGNK